MQTKLAKNVVFNYMGGNYYLMKILPNETMANISSLRMFLTIMIMVQIIFSFG